MPTLEEYLKEAHRRGVANHSVLAMVDDRGEVSICIEPTKSDGTKSLDFIVLDNALIADPC